VREEDNPATIAAPAAAQAEVATREVQPKELVSNQISGLLSKENQYVKAARASGERTAARRGLQNSSIAAQAGEMGAISAALPIAASDAQAYREAAAATQTETGQTGRFNVAEQNALQRQTQSERAAEAAAEKGFGYQTKLQTQAGDIAAAAAEKGFGYQTKLQTQAGDIAAKAAETAFGYDKDLQDRAAAIEKEAAEGRYSHETTLAQMDIDSRQKLQEIQNDFQAQLARDENAANIVNGTLAAIAALVTTPGISAEEISRGSDIIMDQARATLTVMDSDLSDIFPEAPPSAEPTQAEQAATSGGWAGGTLPAGQTILSADVSPGRTIGEVREYTYRNGRMGTPKTGRIYWTKTGWSTEPV